MAYWHIDSVEAQYREKGVMMRNFGSHDHPQCRACEFVVENMATSIAHTDNLKAALREALSIIVAHHKCDVNSGPCAVEDYLSRTRDLIA